MRTLTDIDRAMLAALIVDAVKQNQGNVSALVDLVQLDDEGLRTAIARQRDKTLQAHEQSIRDSQDSIKMLVQLDE